MWHGDQASALALLPFPFFSFSAIGFLTTIFPSNTSITCSTPGSKVHAMIWSHAARALWRRRAAHHSLPRRNPGFSSSFWIRRFIGRAPFRYASEWGSKPAELMCSISSSLGIGW